MTRFRFLDWMRGLAVLVMIQCHTFNSFARPDLREGGQYQLSQFIGGMAAPLFLFMSGMTLAFQMASLDRREPQAGRRWRLTLRRAAYILAVAFAFRITNWLFSLPHADFHEITRVDILNCMGVGLMVMSAGAALDATSRARFSVAAGFGIAAASPLVSAAPWKLAPVLLRDYIAPATDPGVFGFFPNAAYVALGVAAGVLVKTSVEGRFERLMQWFLLAGLAIVFVAQYFGSFPYSVYAHASFWVDSPALTLIRGGTSLLLLAGAYLWTEYGAGQGWSWIECLGRNSLMVYWVHLALVYGDWTKRLQRQLTIPQTAFATAAVVLFMLMLSAAWLRWKSASRSSLSLLNTQPAGKLKPVPPGA
ncbi:MAG TPA: acyltransferase [Bryobacteraceae bacterium]|nr:acyltransferase [Bryobacteraceae bacterium]